LIEEFMKHDVTTVVIDPHGEYSSLRFPSKHVPQMDRFGVKPRGYKDKIQIFSPYKLNRDAKPLQFTLSQISPRELLNILNINDYRAYITPLRKAIDTLKASGKMYSIKDIINVLKSEENTANVSVLISALQELDGIGIFSEIGTRITDIVKKGMVTVIDLKGVPPDIQELVAQRLSNALFEMRKRDAIPPLMLIIEEAHNFIPQQSKALSSKILRTIASEGRKFGLGLCIISQRPAKVDKNVLSQCNTQIILRVTNPNDLRTIGDSVEGLTKSSLDEIQRLPVGVALVTGGNLSMPLFVEIRPRETMHGGESVKIA